MIFAVRSDTSELQLFLLDAEGRIIAQAKKDLGRQMARQILSQIETLLAENEIEWKNLEAVLVFRGPGSFTGLRISTSVANTLSWSLKIPVLGETGENWIKAAHARYTACGNDKIVAPLYNKLANITRPKK